MNRNILAGGLLWCGFAVAQTAPSREALKVAIQARLDAEKPACVVMFDKNDATGHLLLKASRGMFPNPRLDAYYAHGLLIRQETHVSFSDAAIIPVGKLLVKKNNAWRYDWSPAMSADVIDDQLCYGYQRKMDSVERWTAPQGNEMTVSYTWRFEKVSDWAKQPWLESADPDVARTATDKEQTNQRTLTLFNDGWR